MRFSLLRNQLESRDDRVADDALEIQRQFLVADGQRFRRGDRGARGLRGREDVKLLEDLYSVRGDVERPLPGGRAGRIEEEELQLVCAVGYREAVADRWPARKDVIERIVVGARNFEHRVRIVVRDIR